MLGGKNKGKVDSNGNYSIGYNNSYWTSTEGLPGYIDFVDGEGNSIYNNEFQIYYWEIYDWTSNNTDMPEDWCLFVILRCNTFSKGRP